MNKRLLITVLILNSFAGCLAMDEQRHGEESSSEQHFEQADRVCVICAQEITGVMATLPCGHRFCEDCINAWRRQEHTATCPLCRKQIPAPKSWLLPVEGAHAQHLQPGQLQHHPQAAPMAVAHAPVAVPVQVRHAPVEAHVQLERAPVVPAHERELREALLRRDGDRVRQLLSAHPELVHYDDDWPMRMVTDRYPLDEELIRWLIEHGCDVHFNNDELMRDVFSRHYYYYHFAPNIRLGRFLIEHGGDVHFDHDTPMRLFATYGTVDDIQFLLDRGGWRMYLAFLKYSPVMHWAGVMATVLGVAIVTTKKSKK